MDLPDQSWKVARRMLSKPSRPNANPTRLAEIIMRTLINYALLRAKIIRVEGEVVRIEPNMLDIAAKLRMGGNILQDIQAWSCDEVALFAEVAPTEACEGRALDGFACQPCGKVVFDVHVIEN